LIRLAVRVPAPAAEQVLAALLELAPSGVEQVDGDGIVEFAVYGAPGELPELDVGEAEVGGVRVTVSGTEVPGDWAERWRRFHVPVLIRDRLYLRPPWEQAGVRPGVLDLVIDPGRPSGQGPTPPPGAAWSCCSSWPRRRPAARCATWAVAPACWRSPPPGWGSVR
jgi:ribosomal protein L11 methyltransferase